jgi:hypothetical protein
MDNLDERIAELEQRIAEKKAYQRMYAPHKYASTWDYVAEGDRSGLDRMDASEAAYHNMLRQQDQQNAMLKAQQDFNAKQNELNRQNAKEIAEQNRIIGANDKIDELTRLRGKALVNLQYAEAAYKQAEARGNIADIETANRDIQLAKEDLAYYNKRLGTNVSETKSESKQIEDNKVPVKLEVTVEDLNSINSNNTLEEMETALEQAESHPLRGQDKQLESVINKLKSLIENKKAYIADEQFIKNWKDGQPFDKNKFRRLISKGVWILERKK